MRDHSRLILLVLVVGVAGCAGFSPSDSGTSYPDGYNESGITDPETALDQHVSALFKHDNFTQEVDTTEHSLNKSVEITSRVDIANERAAIPADLSSSSAWEAYHAENTSYMK